jgi:hypothetical protein
MPDMPTTTLIFTGSLIGIGLGVMLTALQVWLQGNVQNDTFYDNPRSSPKDPRIELEAR